MLHTLDKHLLIKLLEEVNDLSKYKEEELTDKIKKIQEELNRRHFLKSLNLVKSRLLSLNVIYEELNKYHDIIKNISYISFTYSSDIFKIKNKEKEEEYEIYYVLSGVCYEHQYKFKDEKLINFFEFLKTTYFQNKNLYEIMKDSLLYGMERILGFEAEKIHCNVSPFKITDPNNHHCKRSSHVKLTSKFPLNEKYTYGSEYIYVSPNKIVPIQEHMCFASPRKLSL